MERRNGNGSTATEGWKPGIRQLVSFNFFIMLQALLATMQRMKLSFEFPGLFTAADHLATFQCCQKCFASCYYYYCQYAHTIQKVLVLVTWCEDPFVTSKQENFLSQLSAMNTQTEGLGSFTPWMRNTYHLKNHHTCNLYYLQLQNTWEIFNAYKKKVRISQYLNVL